MYAGVNTSIKSYHKIIFTSSFSLKLNTQFVFTCKLGKPLSIILRGNYKLKYEKDAVEFHLDTIKNDDEILIIFIWWIFLTLD